MKQQVLKIFSVLDRGTKRGLVGLFCLLVLSAVLEMVGISLLIPLFNLFVDSSKLVETPIIGGLIVQMSNDDPNKAILIFSLGLLLFFLVKNIVLGINIYIQNRFIHDRLAEFSCNLLRVYLTLPYTFHLQRNSAELIRNITVLTVRLFAKGLLPIFQFLLEFLTAIGILLITLLVDPITTISIGLILLFSSGLFYFLIKRRIQEWGKRTIEADGEILLWINQSLGSIKEVKLSGRINFFAQAFSKPSFIRARYTALSATAPHLPRLFIEIVAVAGVLLLVISLLVFQGKSVDSIIPTLGLFGIAIIRLMPAFSRMVSNITLFQENTSAVDAIYDDFTAHSNDCSESQLSSNFVDPVGTLSFEKKLNLECVSYFYPEMDKAAITDINLTIPKGCSVALAGRSGAGKSTLVDVILGLLKCDTGKINCDGIDIYENIDDWQRRIGYVPQIIYLTDDTLRNNIALGVANKEIDEDRIIAAARMAQLDPVIAQLSEGLNTVLGEHGTRLSGGQRQRVGIARALYNDPAILVMDEATAALDSETEQEISGAIRQLQGNKTVIVISHRMSTIKQCDLVVYMDQGRISAVGSFYELTQKYSDFSRMVSIATDKSSSN